MRHSPNNHFWFKLQRIKDNLPVIMFSLAIAAIGAYLVVSSHAATPYASNEAETGKLGGGALLQADATASGSQSVTFGIKPAATIVLAVNADVQSALSGITKANTFVELDAGVWNPFTLSNLTLPAGTMITKVPGQAQPTVLGMTISNVANLIIDNFNSPQTNATTQAFEINSSSNNIVFQNSTLDTGNNIDKSTNVQYRNNTIEENGSRFVNNLSLGSNADNVTISGNTIGGGARCLYIWGDIPDETNWPTGLTFTNNSCGLNAPVQQDDVNINGGIADTFTNNQFFVPQQTNGHDDGIQSEGSNNLVIQHNSFDGTPYINCGANCPDQGVIIGDTVVNGSITLTTTNSIVEGNIIHWRGQGIALGGTHTALIANNTIWDNHQCLNVSPFTCNTGYSGINLDTKDPTGVNSGPGLANVGVTIENNIMQSISFGFTAVPPTANYVEDYNCSPNFSGFESGGHDHLTTADPFVDHINYQLNNTAGGGALCRGNGLSPAPVSTDYYGSMFKSPPDIGAVQSS
jgi:hypothetical protein